VRQFVSDANPVATSVVAYVETGPALARLRRESLLTSAKSGQSAKREFEEQWRTFLTWIQAIRYVVQQDRSRSGTVFGVSIVIPLASFDRCHTSKPAN